MAGAIDDRELLSLRGFLADGDTGVGLGGLRVELGQPNGGWRGPLAVGLSDRAGHFGLRLRRETFAPSEGGEAEVELRIFERGELLLSEVRRVPLRSASPVVEVIVPHTGAGEGSEAPGGPGEVCGRVLRPVPDGSTVEVVLRSLTGGGLIDETAAETMVNRAGWYRLAYAPATGSDSADVSLVVRLRGPDGAPIVESDPLLSPPGRARVDLRPPAGTGQISEYLQLQRRVGAELQAGVAGLDALAPEVVEEVASWLHLETDRLLLLQQARLLEAENGLPGALFYGLGRCGLPLALEDLAEVPLAQLRTTVEEAVAGGITCREILPGLEATLDRLGERVVDRLLEPGRQAVRPGLAEVLAAAELPSDATRRLLRRYQARAGDAGAFWQELAGGEDLGEAIDQPDRRRLEATVELAGLLGADPGLLRTLNRARDQGAWQRTQDLIAFDVERWESLLAEAAPPPEGADPDEETEADRAEQVRARAEDIVETLVQRFPSAAIRRQALAEEDLAPAARRLVERAEDHDFLAGSIRTRAAADPALLEGFDEAEQEAALGEVEAVERISRVTPRPQDVMLLVGTGMRSAAAIAATPRRQFIDLYEDALGGRPQAAQVHAQAQQTAAASKMAMVSLLQAHQPGPFVLRGPAPGPRPLPDARTLFGSNGLCECEHCGSVYSPAAYFVDLLRYLNLADPRRAEELAYKLARRGIEPRHRQRLAGQRPLDVLLGRRPDLAGIPLTCENTLTPLPYIDLVNEVLEDRVAGTQQDHDTGKVPADVLRAVPQNLSPAAYQKLQQAVFPPALPYHQPLATARVYLAHLGVTRLELMRALARGGSGREAVVAESLGMSPEEFALCSGPPSELWRQLGFESEQTGEGNYLQALARVPVLLEASGASFQELIDLVSSRFINGDDQMKLEVASANCDPEKVRLEGLDETRLARLLRLVRLRRRLGHGVADLDRLLVALGAREIDPPALEKVAEARAVARLLDRPLPDLLVLWAPLDTWGKDSQFDRLLRTRAVTWRTDHHQTFELRPDSSELARTGDSLDPVAPALLAGYRLTSEDLVAVRALLARRGPPPRLDLAGLSAVYRVVVLARALQLRIDQMDVLLRLVPPDADPFRPGDPAATRRFVEMVRQVQASDFTPEKLAYLFRHESEARRDPAPLPAQVTAVLASVRRGLADAVAETAHPAEVIGDTLRQKLATWLDAALLDPAMEVLDPRSNATPARRRAFFDRHLARIFPDPTAAATRLFGESAPPASATTPVVVPPAGEPVVSPPASEPAAAAASMLGEAPAGVTTAPATSAAERRWQENIQLVLLHLLPQLRARQMRGAVVQTLADALALSSAAAARLLDGVLRSRRRPGEPLLNDFFALLGSGLTASYFANPDLQGEPALMRTEAETAFAWLGAPPAPGLPARGFSVRWHGHLMARARGRHLFYVRSDGAVRLTLKVNGAENVLIDQPAAGAARSAVEHTSPPVLLEAGALAELRLEYRNQGGPASLTLLYGTGPSAKQPVPVIDLYAADGLAGLTAVEQSYRRLHKAALLLTGFGVTDPQLEWLTSEPKLLDLDSLPMAPPAAAEASGSTSDPQALFARWRQLAALFDLRKKLPRANVDLFEVFTAASPAGSLDRLVLATGWDRGVVEAFLGPQGFALDPAAGLRPPADPGAEVPLSRLARAMDLQRRLGAAPAALFAWAEAAPDADTTAAIVQAVKARYDEQRWLEVARTLNDPLRAERRDALVAYLLPRMRAQGVSNRAQLFEHFLIDVDMNPCMLSSRIRQGISTVQTFFQRCLMNLEPQVNPRLIDQDDWKWLKSYRVWEANRKIFLYPENWIEPELREDKSPLFLQLERSILQQEIKNENVEAAFADYLEGLDEIARLDIRAVWFEPRDPVPTFERRKRAALGIPEPPPQRWDEGTYHVFGRTFNAPHVWYYRRLDSGRSWLPWEKIDADIEGEHLVPVIYQRRLHLFWTVFREVSKPPPAPSTKREKPPAKVAKDWEVQLAYSVLDRGRWSRKRLSADGALDRLDFHVFRGSELTMEGSGALSPRDYTLRAAVHGSRLELALYRRRIDSLRSAASTSIRAGLADGEVDEVARFGLDGCNGELVLTRAPHGRGVTIVGLPPAVGRRVPLRGKRGRRPPSQPTVRSSPGGRALAPAGYRVDGSRFSPARGSGGALLTLPAPRGGGLTPVLGAPRQARGSDGVRLVPLVDPGQHAGRLFPFFFQDRQRTYFARPVYSDWQPPRLVAVPLIGRRALPPAVASALRRRSAAHPARRGRPAAGRGRREELELDLELEQQAEQELETLAADPDRLDAWEDTEDEAWHPDDLTERRTPRRPPPQRPPQPAARGRRPPPAPARPLAIPRPAAPQIVVRREEGHHREKLRFYPFEHPDTCRLILTLKSHGVERLLAFRTTRPAGAGPSGSGRHFLQRYAPGPLTDTSSPPALEIDFDPDSPYALYNWELFFHAPFQVAIRLAKDGRHEEAQRWFHFIFDPTSDASAPAPQRYWNFAPFRENTEYASAREQMALLARASDDPQVARRQLEVRRQLAAWWEKPFSPHVIARLRIAAYQKAVVMKYIENLVEWADKLFRRDSMESINEATQLYILASNILGPRPERIPPIVATRPATFRQIRDQLDVFANWEVGFENTQVRRPFRINARPDVGGARSILGMATQYFCLPPNPQMDRTWDTVADRLFKIRNCMNIQGVVRQLPLFEPPLDPGLLVRAAAAGVDLGSVVASLNAPPPHYRFRVLLARALRLAEEIRSFGQATLQVLERRDAEGLAALRATNETALLESAREIRKKQVRQVEEALSELALEREHIDLQAQHINTQMQELMNPQEAASQKSLSAAQVVAGIAEGVDLVSKVLYAIPEMQGGTAGGFSSPFVTLQLGGQMFGDISAAFAGSLQKVIGRNETEAELAEAQAEFQRRRAEWQHELELLAKEKAQIDKKVTETQLKLEISNAELRRHDLEVENARKVERYLRDKYTSEQLYGWMLGQLSTVYFQAYKLAFDAAQQAERAFRFERGDSGASFVEFSYWDSLKKGLFAGERLLLDLRRMEAAHLEGDRRALEITRHLSLREEHPAALQELRATGRCQLEVSEALLDGDFPGHYFRRLKTVSLSAVGTFRSHSNLNCTLTLLENRIRTEANASGSYPQSEDGDDSRFLTNFAPLNAVATSRPGPDAGLFELRFDDERYLPFEGAGAISTWRIELRQSDNAVDLGELGDLVLTLSYSARAGGAALEAAARASREKGLGNGGLRPAPQLALSLRRDLPALWKQLAEAMAGKEVELTLPLEAERFSGRYRGLAVRVERVVAFAQARVTLREDALQVRVDPPRGSGAPLAGWTRPWPDARVLRAAAEVSGTPGPWKLTAGARGARLPDLIDDLVLLFEVRVRKG
jgi:hypothetical protein